MRSSINLYSTNNVVTDLLGHENWRSAISTADINFSLEKLGKRRWIFWKRPHVAHQLKVQEGRGYEGLGYQLELDGGGQLNLVKIGIPQPEKVVEEGKGAFVRKVRRVDVLAKYLVWIGVPEQETVVGESADWELKSHDSFDAFWGDVVQRTKKYRPVVSSK